MCCLGRLDCPHEGSTIWSPACDSISSGERRQAGHGESGEGRMRLYMLCYMVVAGGHIWACIFTLCPSCVSAGQTHCPDTGSNSRNEKLSNCELFNVFFSVGYCDIDAWHHCSCDMLGFMIFIAIIILYFC